MKVFLRSQTLAVCFIAFQLFTLSVYSQVEQEWVQRFTSDSTLDENVQDMFVDAQGNVYVTGSQKSGFGLLPEAVTVKYNTDGEQQWIQNYHAPENNGAFCRAIYVDAAGNSYVTGENAISSGGSNEMLVIKYSPTGTQEWANRFQYIAQFYTGGYDIIADNDGNVYVTGEYYTGATYYNNIFLVKYGPSGDLINQTFYNSASEGGRKIGLDGAGKIIVSGYINSDSLSFIALKYEQNLDFDWATIWGKVILNQNTIDMAIDNNSNIILTGTDGTTIDYSTVKIDPAGNVLWGKNFSSSEGWDKSAGVVKDDYGNIYVSGATGSLGFPLSFNMTTIKYAPNGDELWMREYDTTATTMGYQAVDIAIDNDANTYIIGQSSDNDIVTIKYDSAGMFNWAISYNGPSNSLDIPIAVGVDPDGNIYSSGNSLDTTSGYDIVIIKYVQSPTSINKIESSASFSLQQNFPNPFSLTTTIGFILNKESIVNLKVYDLTGRLVQNLCNKEFPVGKSAIIWNGFDDQNRPVNPGVYVCRMTIGNETRSIRMVIQ